MDPDAFWKDPALNLKLWPRSNALSLKWTLGIIDIILAMLCFVFSAVLFDYLAMESLTLERWLSVLLFAVLAVIFFPSQRLYSRHLIFSKRKHVLNLFKALTSGFLSISFVVTAFVMPEVDRHYCLILLLMVFSGLFVISRFGQLENNFTFHLIKVFGTSMLAAGVLGLLFDGRTPDLLRQPELVIYGNCLAMIYLFIIRLCVVHLLFQTSLKRRFRRQVAIVGSDEQGHGIVSYIIDRNAPFWVAGTIGDQGYLNAKFKKDCLGTLKELPRIVAAHGIDELLIADQDLDKRVLISILDYCLGNGIHVWFPPRYLEIIDRKLYIDDFCGLPMIKLCSPKRIWVVNKVKHALDALISLPLFALLLPLFGAIAAAVKLSSPGPVFYRAKAIGKGGHEFTMYKFRSMRMNNDAGVHKDYVTKLIKGEIGNDKDQGQPLKLTNDSRITKVGNILRKLSLDELPQLINVIKGDMSLVGPRPCLPYEFEVYKDWYKKRASIRPGITGLWQVAGRSEVSFEEMILLDLYYVYNRSVWMDLNILTETVFVVLEKRGAY